MAAFRCSHSCFSLKQQWHLSPDLTSILATRRLRLLELAAPTGARLGDRRPPACILVASVAWRGCIPSPTSGGVSLSSGQPGSGDRRPVSVPFSSAVACWTTCCELLAAECCVPRLSASPSDAEDHNSAESMSMSLSEAASSSLSRLSGVPRFRPSPSATVPRFASAGRIVPPLRTGRLIGVPGMRPRGAETAVLRGRVAGPALSGSGSRAMLNSLGTAVGGFVAVVRIRWVP